MDVTASELYGCNVQKSRQLCSEEGSEVWGTVRLLRQRLTQHLMTIKMESKQVPHVKQASVHSDQPLDGGSGGNPGQDLGAHGGGGAG
jgi:hypothetical protein